MSDDKKPLNIHQCLFNVMKEIAYIQKDGKAEFGSTKYKFVGHDKVTASVRPLFMKHNILCMPSVESHERNGNLTTVSLMITLLSMEDNSSVCFHFPGTGIDTQDKGVGKAISYAFRYALLKILMLETGDDPERDNIDHKTSEEIQEEKKEALRNVCDSMVKAFEDRNSKLVDELKFKAKGIAKLDKELNSIYQFAINIIKKSLQEKK